MFVRFGVGASFSKPGFSAKIHFGNYHLLLTYANHTNPEVITIQKK